MPYTRTISLCAAFAITGVGLVAMTTPAFGRDQPVVVQGPSEYVITKRVSYADLNLASASGERTLNRRVGDAVTSVCDEANPNAMMFIINGCQKASWNDARPQIARAVQRAREIAMTGHSSIAAAAITITIPE